MSPISRGTLAFFPFTVTMEGLQDVCRHLGRGLPGSVHLSRRRVYLWYQLRNLQELHFSTWLKAEHTFSR